MSLKPKTQREQIMLLLAFLILMIAGYGFVRMRLGFKQVRQLRQEQAIAKAELSQVNMPRTTADDLGKVQAEGKRLSEDLQRLKTQLFPLEKRLLDGTLSDTRVLVSSIAESSNVKIIQNVPHGIVPVGSPPPGPVQPQIAPRTAADILQGYYARPQFRLVTQSSYPSLRMFIDQLPRMPRRVTISKFELEVEKTPDEWGRHLLTAKMILTL